MNRYQTLTEYYVTNIYHDGRTVSYWARGGRLYDLAAATLEAEGRTLRENASLRTVLAILANDLQSMTIRPRHASYFGAKKLWRWGKEIHS